MGPRAALLVVAAVTSGVYGRAVAPAPPPKPTVATLLRDHAEACLHVAVVLMLSREPAQSVRTDEWKAIRHRPPDLASGRGRIFRRRRRAAQVGGLLGVGYTPRIVCLAGLMLRSLQMSTRIRDVFDPSSGFAAGAMLAASYAQREWIPCLLLGWGLGGVYWSAFRVRPPGVAIQDVQFKFH
jgi:hypothetical protein